LPRRSTAKHSIAPAELGFRARLGEFLFAELMVDRWVIEQNVARFRAMLRDEIAPTRRREIECLLAEEEARLAEVDRKTE